MVAHLDSATTIVQQTETSITLALLALATTEALEAAIVTTMEASVVAMYSVETEVLSVITVALSEEVPPIVALTTVASHHVPLRLATVRLVLVVLEAQAIEALEAATLLVASEEATLHAATVEALVVTDKV